MLRLNVAKEQRCLSLSFWHRRLCCILEVDIPFYASMFNPFYYSVFVGSNCPVFHACTWQRKHILPCIVPALENQANCVLNKVFIL